MGPVEPASPAPASRWPGPWQVMVLSAWFGLLSGLIEVLTKVVCASIGRSGHLYQMSRHFFWLIPVTNLLLFILVGVFLALIKRLGPRLGSWLGVRVLVALAVLPPFLVAFPEIYTWAWMILAWGIAIQAGKILQRHPACFQRIVLATLPVLTALVLVLTGWVMGRDWLKEAGESARPLPPPGSPNVLLIVLDTVRADRLSVYGYARKTTPTLERIASEGVRFDAARSTSSWTLPAHASMFTGRLPHELRAKWLAPVSQQFPTLAGYLGSQGYATAGFVANTLYCAYDTGLNQGFTHYEDYTLEQMDGFLMARLTERGLTGLLQLASWIEAHGSTFPAPFISFIDTYVFNGKRKDAAAINRQFLNWLGRRAEPERPFFAFLNYMDAHEAYLPPRPSDCRFGLRPASPDEIAVLQNWEQIDKPRLDSRLKVLASDCYDNCINYLDRQLQALFTNLATQRVLEHTLVVVVADHGESFGEHDLYVHGDSLYRPETHVPLLIMMPWHRPARNVISETVSLRDLPATIVDLLDLRQDSRFNGNSLARFWKGTGPLADASDWAVSELESPNPANPNQGRSPARHGKLTALTRERYTYIVSDKTEELYDEVSDAAETKNLALDEAMKPVLDRFRDQVRRVLQPRAR